MQQVQQGRLTICGASQIKTPIIYKIKKSAEKIQSDFPCINFLNYTPC